MRQFITGDDVHVAHASGKQAIHIRLGDVVTSVAREQAEKYGIPIVEQKGLDFLEAKPSPTGTAAPQKDRFVPSLASPETLERSTEIPPSPPFDIEYWKGQFPLLKTHIHVANCSHAPQSTFTRQATLEYLENWNRMGMDWDRWMEEVQLAKEEFGKIINADPSQIAIGTSVSEITSAIASSLPLNTNRRRIVVTDAEFPTVGFIWQAQKKYGFEVRFIPVRDGTIDPGEYDSYVDEYTMLTSITDTYYYNGFKQDLARIVPKIHEKGSLVYVDAYQGLGTHPLDVKALDIDFLSSGNLKYLLGVPGIAFLYVKKELIDNLHPSFTGWFGQENPFAFDIHNFVYAKDARRFDNGTPPVPAAYIARAGMKIINTVGVENIFQWTNTLSAHCMKGALDRDLDLVSPRDLSIKAPNTAIRVPGDSHDFELALRKENVIASARADVVRIAAHFFVTLEDIDYVLDCFPRILNK